MAQRRNKRVYKGLGKRDSTQSSVRKRMRTKNNETQMFAAGHLDTIYLVWESPSSNLSRDAGYLRVPS